MSGGAPVTEAEWLRKVPVDDAKIEQAFASLAIVFRMLCGLVSQHLVEMNEIRNEAVRKSPCSANSIGFAL